MDPQNPLDLFLLAGFQADDHDFGLGEKQVAEVVMRHSVQVPVNRVKFN